MKILTDVEYNAIALKNRTRTSVHSKLETYLNKLFADKTIVKGNKVCIECKDITGENQGHYYNALLMLNEKFVKTGKISKPVWIRLPKAQFTSVSFIVL